MALQPTSDGLQPSKRYLVAKASNLLAMALQPTSDGLQPSKRYLVAKASNLEEMASNLLAMVSNLAKGT